MKLTHDSHRDRTSRWLIVLVILVVARRRPGRDRAAVLPALDDRAGRGLKPYTPLQLTGRDIYIREGCYNCHSQMIRPFRAETERYGHYSVAGEFVYDHPFQWGSKRTGPDLARVGGRYSRRVAPHAPQQSARRGAGIEHAGLSVARAARRRTPTTSQAKMRALRTRRRAVHRRGDRQGARASSRARPSRTR